MPITSERLSLIVEEALAIARSASDQRQACADCLELAKVDPAQGLSFLQSYLLINPLPQPLHLLLEQRHHKISAKGNARKREKARVKRRAQGVEERPQTASVSLADLGLGSPLQDDYNSWNKGEK